MNIFKKILILLSLIISFSFISFASSDLNYIKFHTSNSCSEVYSIEFICLDSNKLQFLKGECMSKKKWYQKALSVCESQSLELQTLNRNFFQLPSLNFSQPEIIPLFNILEDQDDIKPPLDVLNHHEFDHFHADHKKGPQKNNKPQGPQFNEDNHEHDSNQDQVISIVPNDA